MAEQFHLMTLGKINGYLEEERKKGASETMLRQRKRFVLGLYDWLPEDKTVTKEILQNWREELYTLGYAAASVGNYIKGVNRYLNYTGNPELCFRQGRAKKLEGMEFGYLTAVEPTGERDRRDLIWRCRCRCGKEVCVSAARLLRGNTLSCGCLKTEHLKRANRYIDQTSLRACQEERVESSNAASGYTGVGKKREKWTARIKFQGKTYFLGSYSQLQDAVKARAKGKEWVQSTAEDLEREYQQIHGQDPDLPSREKLSAAEAVPLRQRENRGCLAKKRSDNTSGLPGVSRKGSGWMARITHQKVTYHLGCYQDKAAAVEARLLAQQVLEQTPEYFPQWVVQWKQRKTKADRIQCK